MKYELEWTHSVETIYSIKESKTDGQMNLTEITMKRKNNKCIKTKPMDK